MTRPSGLPYVSWDRKSPLTVSPSGPGRHRRHCGKRARSQNFYTRRKAASRTSARRTTRWSAISQQNDRGGGEGRSKAGAVDAAPPPSACLSPCRRSGRAASRCLTESVTRCSCPYRSQSRTWTSVPTGDQTTKSTLRPSQPPEVRGPLAAIRDGSAVAASDGEFDQISSALESLLHGGTPAHGNHDVSVRCAFPHHVGAATVWISGQAL